MAQEQPAGLLHEQVLEYFRFREFRWWELLIIAGGLSALLGYAMLALYLDRRSRARARRARQRSRVQMWLEQLDLLPSDEQQLRELAGDDSDLALYELLSDPARFETAVHHALAQGERVDFAETVRREMGFHSDHPGAPIASTRQLLPGDHFRLSAWEAGRPQHHYGVVTAVSPAGVYLELTEAGFRAAHDAGAELFYLRGGDVEYRFPLALRDEEPVHHRILIRHALVQGGHRPRGTRLPMLRPVTVILHTQLAAAEPEPPTEGGAARHGGTELKAALLEMSEGGFSMALLRPVAEGAYLEFPLAMPRGRSLQITGRVLDCRAFADKRWLVRCEQRGLSRTQRNTLVQLLRLEQRARIRAMEAERRRRRHAEDAPA